tara:strand:- start:1245 stop:1931 length:687 start_codon:yes stop_codon:yes gene_type:complete
MILSKDIFDSKKLKLKRCRQFTNGYQFFPLVYDKKQLVYQTPLLYVPYGVQAIEQKQYLTLSTMNQNYDKQVQKFIHTLHCIEFFLQSQLKETCSINILKEDRFRVKLHNCLYFDEHKRLIDDIPSNVYGHFIINIYGVWNCNNVYYVQCYLLQCKLCMPFYLTNYGFIEETKSNIPPAPPLPPKITTKKYERKKQIVPQKKQSQFKPPSLLEIQNILQTLKSSNLTN